MTYNNKYIDLELIKIETDTVSELTKGCAISLRLSIGSNPVKCKKNFRMFMSFLILCCSLTSQWHRDSHRA